MKIYYKGEITASKAAERVGFAMPESGVYPGQLGKNVAGKEEVRFSSSSSSSSSSFARFGSQRTPLFRVFLAYMPTPVSSALRLFLLTPFQ